MLNRLFTKFVNCVLCRRGYTITFLPREKTKQVPCPHCGGQNNFTKDNSK